MEKVQTLLASLDSIIWGEYVLIPLLAITGIYLTIGLKGITWSHIPYAFKRLWEGRVLDKEQGDISPFQALMTALSATPASHC